MDSLIVCHGVSFSFLFMIQTLTKNALGNESYARDQETNFYIVIILYKDRRCCRWNYCSTFKESGISSKMLSNIMLCNQAFKTCIRLFYCCYCHQCLSFIWFVVISELNLEMCFLSCHVLLYNWCFVKQFVILFI